MINKKSLLSLGASLCFAGCAASTNDLNLQDQFLKKTNETLGTKIERQELSFKADGRQGRDFYWVMTKEQFESFKKLVEYTVVGCKVVVDKNDTEKKRVEFVGKVDFKRNDHFCCVKKAGLLNKLLMCIKAKSPAPLLRSRLVHVASSDAYTHVAIRCDLQIRKFDVVDRGSRVYRNVPATSKIGNLPGIYLRGNGKTSKTGDLVGFSFRIEKNGDVRDQFFGNIWKNTEKS